MEQNPGQSTRTSVFAIVQAKENVITLMKIILSKSSKVFASRTMNKKKNHDDKISMPNDQFQAQPAMATVFPTPHLSGRLDGLLE